MISLTASDLKILAESLKLQHSLMRESVLGITGLLEIEAIQPDELQVSTIAEDVRTELKLSCECTTTLDEFKACIEAESFIAYITQAAKDKKLDKLCIEDVENSLDVTLQDSKGVEFSATGFNIITEKSLASEWGPNRINQRVLFPTPAKFSPKEAVYISYETIAAIHKQFSKIKTKSAKETLMSDFVYIDSDWIMCYNSDIGVYAAEKQTCGWAGSPMLIRYVVLSAIVKDKTCNIWADDSVMKFSISKPGNIDIYCSCANDGFQADLLANMLTSETDKLLGKFKVADIKAAIDRVGTAISKQDAAILHRLDSDSIRMISSTVSETLQSCVEQEEPYRFTLAVNLKALDSAVNSFTDEEVYAVVYDDTLRLYSDTTYVAVVLESLQEG